MCWNNLSFSVTQEHPMLTVMFLTVLTLTSSTPRLSTKTTSSRVLSWRQVNNLDPLHRLPGRSQNISDIDSEKITRKRVNIASILPIMNVPMGLSFGQFPFIPISPSVRVWHPHFHPPIVSGHVKDLVARALFWSLSHLHPVPDINDPVPNNTIEMTSRTRLLFTDLPMQMYIVPCILCHDIICIFTAHLVFC